MDKHRLPIILGDSPLPSRDVHVPVRINFGGTESARTRRRRPSARIVLCVAFLLLALWGVSRITPVRAFWSRIFSSNLSTDTTPTLPSQPTDTEVPTAEETTNAHETTENITTDAATEAETEADDGQEYFTSDMSLWELGVTHIDNTTILAPDVRALLSGAPSSIDAILIVTSHPTQAYVDGGSVRELAVRLEKALSEKGIMALYAAPPTLSDTAAVINYYLNLYPEIDLVIDLCRSAELSDDGRLLRPIYTLGEHRHAQIRIICDSRGDGAHMTEENLAFALKLREQIFGIHPAASRPVWLREGRNSHGGKALFFTVEIGAAGNCATEAERALDTLADALSTLSSKR